MSSVGSKNKSLSSQANAVSDYLDCLLSESEVDEQSAARAAENIAALVGAGLNQLDQDEVIEAETSDYEELEVEGAQEDFSYEDELEEENALVLDYKDSSGDPEIIAEAEKMLSYVIDEDDDTPLARLRRAGVASSENATPAATEQTAHDTPSDLVPAYASERFTMMKFRVGAVQMLISVTELASVDKPQRAPSSVVGASPWILQYQKPGASTHYLVDGETLFVPPGKFIRSNDTEKFIIWLKGVPVGILCDEVQDMVEINRRQVGWRGSKFEQPWLAGNLRSMRALLLDGKGLIELLRAEVQLPS